MDGGRWLIDSLWCGVALLGFLLREWCAVVVYRRQEIGFLKLFMPSWEWELFYAFMGGETGKEGFFFPKTTKGRVFFF